MSIHLFPQTSVLCVHSAIELIHVRVDVVLLSQCLAGHAGVGVRCFQQDFFNVLLVCSVLITGMFCTGRSRCFHRIISGRIGRGRFRRGSGRIGGGRFRRESMRRTGGFVNIFWRGNR
uniref:Uncharacterized protein n=1 Tax=Cacopsylla melanoneura TaxID=428564 RepID=A0A8D8QQZ0_9HEMI